MKRTLIINFAVLLTTIAFAQRKRIPKIQNHIGISTAISKFSLNSYALPTTIHFEHKRRNQVIGVGLQYEYMNKNISYPFKDSLEMANFCLIGQRIIPHSFYLPNLFYENKKFYHNLNLLFYYRYIFNLNSKIDVFAQTGLIARFNFLTKHRFSLPKDNIYYPQNSTAYCIIKDATPENHNNISKGLDIINPDLNVATGLNCALSPQQYLNFMLQLNWNKEDKRKYTFSLGYFHSI